MAQFNLYDLNQLMRNLESITESLETLARDVARIANLLDEPVED